MKILVAVDTTDAHDAAVAARELFPNGEHIIISAASIAPFVVTEPLGGGLMSSTPSLAALEVAEQEADSAIESAREVLGDKPQSSVEIGDPGRVICEQAKSMGVDVIVVGRRSASWLSRLFDPSVSEYVIKHASCPVLVVNEHHASKK